MDITVTVAIIVILVVQYIDAKTVTKEVTTTKSHRPILLSSDFHLPSKLNGTREFIIPIGVPSTLNRTALDLHNRSASKQKTSKQSNSKRTDQVTMFEKAAFNSDKANGINVDYNMGVYREGEYGYDVINLLNEVISPSIPVSEFKGLQPTQFRLFSRSNPINYQLVTTQNVLASSNFKATRDTMIIIHGWSQEPTKQNILNIKDAILKQFDMNVIIVDWSYLSLRMYNIARFGIADVAADVAKFIVFLNQQGGQSYDIIHEIGFSLGAHIAGIAGKIVGGKIANIIGLDPAFPLFSIWSTKDRLNVGDARYVQVLHTTGDFVAFMAPLGDYDVYPNGGKKQPSCVETIPMCSHALAQTYCTASILNPSTYFAYQCTNFLQLSLGYCKTTGVVAPLIQIKPKEKFYGVFWAQI